MLGISIRTVGDQEGLGKYYLAHAKDIHGVVVALVGGMVVTGRGNGEEPLRTPNPNDYQPHARICI